MSAKIVNKTPFPHFVFSNSDNRGLQFGVVMVKAALDIGDDGTTAASEDQEPFWLADKPYGDLNASSLHQPSDLVGYKPATDIIIDAVAYAPGGKPATAWLAGVKVDDETGERCRKVIKITGPRQWRPRWQRPLSDDERRNWKDHRDLFQGWELTEPEPIASLPVRYEYAYGGGVDQGPDDTGAPVIKAYHYNPIGRGLIHAEETDHTRAWPAAQIENPDQPITEPYTVHWPQGFGAIPPAWQPRRRLGGTFDQHWIDHIWPKWPPDYDFAYNNAAAEGLKAEGFLHGDIKVQLVNLHPEQTHRIITIPDLTPYAFVSNTGGRTQVFRTNLDTVFVAASGSRPLDHRVFLTWRLVFNMEETTAIALEPMAETHKRMVAELGLPLPPSGPLPSSCAVPGRALERPEQG